MVEVIIALLVIFILMVSALTALTYSHRKTQEIISQNAAYASARACMEQLTRGLSFNDLAYTDSSNSLFSGNGNSISGSAKLSVLFNGNVSKDVYVQKVALPDLSALSASRPETPDATETQVFLDINNTPASTKDDVELRVLLWVKDASVSAVDATQVRAIYVVYYWRYTDGVNKRWHVEVIRNMRSAAPTF